MLPRPTFRALLVISISLFLLFSAARINSDIIAAGFATSVLTVSSFIYWLLYVCSREISNNTKIQIKSSSLEGHYAKEPVQLYTTIENLKIPFLLKAICKLHSVQDGMQISEHELPSSTNTTFQLEETVSFNHRGKWSIRHISIQLFDTFGLFATTPIKMELDYNLTVIPREQEAPAWNALSSSIKEDNNFPHDTQKKGDYYDFKPYHPSDGSKRIVWKLFAKSAQLFSRHPEPSYSPEGKLGIFSLAGKNDDRLVSQLFQFCSKLEQDSIEIFFSTLSSNQNLAKNSQDVLDLSIEHVWFSEQANLTSINENIDLLISSLSTGSSKPEALCIAVSERAMAEIKIQGFVQNIQEKLSRDGIRPHFLISKVARNHIHSEVTKRSTATLLNSLIFKSDAPNTESDLSDANRVIASLNTNQSEVQWS